MHLASRSTKMEMVNKEVQSLTDNMNRATCTTATLQLGSSESASKEGGQGDDTNDINYHTESNNSSYHTEDDSYDTPNEHDIDPVDCSIGALAWSLGQKVVLSFNGYCGKRSEYSLAKPKDAT